MRLEDDIDFTTLNWVKPELDETLSRARQALEDYVDAPEDAGPMQACAAGLHQVQGTLRMVELYGAAMVVQEMELLVAALLGDEVPSRDDAYAALMRGLMQLPDYLERLQTGYRDIPVVLLPLLNELRTCRGASALHESELFQPDLEAPLPSQVPGAGAGLSDDDQRREVVALRLRFQKPLLAWFRGQDEAAAVARMRDTLDLLAAHCHTLAGRRLWWIAAAVLDGLGQGVLDAHGVEVKQIIGRVDRCIRILVEQGEAALAEGEAVTLEHKLLYYAARAQTGSPRIEDVRSTYRLDQLLPDAAEVEHARGSMAGHNRELLDTVAQAIKDDLLNVKDALEVFLHQDPADVGRLAEQGEVLDRVGDTLGMLGLNVPRRIVGEQRRILQDMGDATRSVDEDVLLDVAGALLYVEASLDDHIERLGVQNSEPEGEQALPRSEARQVMAALMREAVHNIDRVKNMLVAFVESPWDHQHVSEAPALLEEVRGALRMINAGRPVDLIEGISRFIGNELVTDARVPSPAQMDTLADALASIEYYVEAARERRGGLGHILDVAEQSLERLGYWPVPAPRASLEPVPVEHPEDLSSWIVPEDSATPAMETQAADARADVAGSDETTDASEQPATEPRPDDVPRPAAAEHDVDTDADPDWVEIEEEVTEQVPMPDAMASRAGFQGAAEEIDAEIREVFLEEVQEEIEALEGNLEQWLRDPENLDLLGPIRRSFHTLKGSGRLVGAEVLGEFSWKTENMLNRVLDGTIEPHAGVRELTRHAVEALPQLLRALQGKGTPEARLVAMTEVADRLADGDTHAVLEPVAEEQMQTVTHRVKRRVPRESIATDAPTPAVDAAGASGEISEDGVQVSGLPSMDPVLVDVLRHEVTDHLAHIRAAVTAADGGDAAADEVLLRAVHTLHGAVAMVDIAQLSDVLSPLEGWLKRLRAQDQPVPAADVAVLTGSADLIEAVASQFDAAEPQLPDVSPLAERLRDLRDQLPEPQLAHPLYTEADDGADGDEADAVEPAFVSDSDAQTAASAAGFESAGIDTGEQTGEPSGEEIPLQEAPVAGVEATETDSGTEHAQTTDDARAWTEPTGSEEASGSLEPADAAGSESADTSEPVDVESEFTGTFESAQSESESTDTPERDQEEPEFEDMSHPAEEEPETVAMPESVEAFPEPVSTPAPETFEEPVSRPAALGSLSDDFHFPADPQPDGELDLPELDPELLDIFIEEGNDLLDHADSATADLRAQPDDSETTLVGLRRDLHTLKGSARMASLAPIGDLAHAMESLLDALGKGHRDLDADVVESLERGCDYLHDMVQRADARQGLATPQRIIAHFEALVEGLPTAETNDLEPSSTTKPAAVEAAPVEAETAPAVADEPVAPAPQRDLLPEPEAATAAGPQESIRVRSDLIDALVNHAGEASIYRSRLEQQISGFRFSLAEFDQTVTRLRDQLRKLEIETEAQIIARYQREHEDEGSFDPLELDRFSQLQQYSRALAESVSDLVALQGMLDDNTRQSETLLLQQSRVNSDLQEGLMRTRMVPFDFMVPTLRRTLRQASQETGKRAQLRVSGAHDEMDRNLLERLKAPFEHMLRNALAHGIESPEERREAGKPEEGTVSIEVSRDATEVVIRVSDDGGGMDRDAIRAKAIARGLLSEEAQLSDQELFGFVLESGFSTAGEVSQLAGRGVGMDVVANEIKQLGGTLQIDSRAGKGTVFMLRVPFTLAVTQAVLVKVGEATFAVPMTSVHAIARAKPADREAASIEPGASFAYAGEDYTIHDLAGLLGVPAGHVGDDQQQPLLLARAGDLHAAVRVDQVIGAREVVVKPVGPQISSVPGIFGATIIGDGSVLLILDVAPLVRHGLARAERQAEAAAVAGDDHDEAGVSQTPQAPGQAQTPEQATVMVVDDSITMRRVTGRILERHEFRVMTATDGMDAVEKLQERVPDLMLLDIEMPRMDGYELATHMRNDPRLEGVPIIMITSRTGEKHRQRALDLGVDRYVGKPYQEADLMEQIGQLLEDRDD